MMKCMRTEPKKMIKKKVRIEEREKKQPKKERTRIEAMDALLPGMLYFKIYLPENTHAHPLQSLFFFTSSTVSSFENLKVTCTS